MFGATVPHPIWKKIWSLKVPGKVKIFVWRCLHNAIPCFCVLANRHIGNVSQCPICQVGAEDIKHAIFSCERAKAVWSALGIWNSISDALLVDRSGATVLEFLLCDQALQKTYMNQFELPELIATASWYIWWQRRMHVRGEEVQSPVRTGPSIHALTLNFTRAMAKPVTGPRVNTWPSVLAAQQVLNVDASFREEDSTGSCGAIIRDHRGNFIAASTSRLEHVPDVVSAEAAALVEGLKLVQSLGCNDIIARTDNMIIVNALRLNEGQSMVAAPVLEECRDLMRDLGKVFLMHCNRESNMTAHVLAEFGSANDPSLWVEAPPSFIAKYLADDVAVI
jgi:ribonuclease HI